MLTALCALLAHGWEKLLHGFQTPSFTLLAAALAGIALGMFAVAALGAHTGVGFSAMQQRSVEFNEQRVNVSAHLVTGNPVFLPDKPMFHLPYPSPERLKEFLDDPTLRSTLHRRLFVTPAQAISAALEQDPEMGPASYAGREILAARRRITVAACYC